MKVRKLFPCHNSTCQNTVEFCGLQRGTTVQQFCDFLPHIDMQQVSAITPIEKLNHQRYILIKFSILLPKNKITVKIGCHWGDSDYVVREQSVRESIASIYVLHNQIISYWKSIKPENENEIEN